MPPVAARLLLALAAMLALIAAGCGDGRDDDGAARPAATATDAAFVTEMLAHHEDAVRMAAQARAQARHDELARFAASVDRAQRAEIARMEDLRDELPDPPPGGLGMSAHEQGVHALPRADDGTPYDLAFLDAMIAHHEGAIAMARKALMGGRHPEVRTLATTIARDQHEEVHRMERWRAAWFPREPVAEDDAHQ